jgi:hypothetical protein
MKNKLVPIGIGLGIVVVVAFIGYALMQPDTSAQQSRPATKSNNPDVVSDTEIHWHPEISIYINGAKQEIPSDIGLGEQYKKNRWYDPMMRMTDVHTHDKSDQLHWEVMKDKTPVTKDHVQLGVFFEIWGKRFSKAELLDKTDPTGRKISMKVNGQPNTEFENHVVADKEKIEIRYQD